MNIPKKLSLSILAFATVLGAAHGSTLMRRIEAMEGQIDILRKLISDVYCAQHSDGGFTTGTGAWCLHKAGEYEGRPIADLHFMDTGIGPLLSRWLSGKRVLDLGAGSGQYGTKFEIDKANITYTGLDGAVNVVEFTSGRVQWADLAAPLAVKDAPFDWVMSLEVGEHIPSAFEHILFDNLHYNNKCGVILSWAVPGQAGHGHVNNHDNDYVISKMDALGYDYNAAVAKIGRDAAQMAWFHNTFMVFNRRSAANETRCALNVDDPPQAVAVPAVAPATVAAPATAAAPVVVTAEAMAAGR